SLERQVSALLRKVALKVAKERGADLIQKKERGAVEDADAPRIDFSNEERLVIDAKDVVEMIGPHKFRDVKSDAPDLIGLTHGLSVSDYGGDILACEVSVVPGKGKLSVTGLLEKGMEESAKAALSYVRSRAKLLGLESDFYETKDFHVHFPEFIRKDGPSAGVTMATSFVSALTRIPVRHDVAMTGEITLRGRVMPIGGLKEKLLAAHRNKMKTVLVPKDNEKDLREVPDVVKSALRIVLIGHMDEVLREALSLEDPDSLFGKAESEVHVYREVPAEEDDPAVDPLLPPGTSVPASPGERPPA